MSTERISDVARSMQRALGILPQQINDTITVVKRKRCFTPTTLVQSFLFALLQKPRAGDSDIATMAAKLGVNVTPQAIDARYSETLAKFFRELFGRIATTKFRSHESLGELMDRFTEVIAIDSTVITLPEEMADEFPGCGGGATSGLGSGNSAALKLQTELNLKTGGLSCVQLESARSPDSATDRQQIHFKKGSLRLADLGYFSVVVLARLVACMAHFVSRVQFQTHLQIDGQTQSVIDFLRQQSKSVGMIDTQVYLGQQQKLACRFIAWRIPDKIAAERRRKLRKTHRKKGKTPSQDALAACDWNMLVTDLSQDKLSIAEAIVLYRSRWQIELLFKRWKSHCEIDRQDGATSIHVRCRFWMRLCVAILQQQLVAACCWGGEQIPSFSKVAQSLKVNAIELVLSLGSARRIGQAITRLAKEVQKTCRRTKRGKKPAWIELLRDPSKLEYFLTWC